MSSNRNYPHINDTAFPDAASIDAYKYQQNFDYSRYSTENSTAHLLTVPWRSDYTDAAHFGSEAARDAWLDSKFGDGVELPSMFRLYDAGELKIELPIDVAMKYNYLVIDYTEITSSDNPVIGEATDGIRRMCYFITDMTQESVNTTKLTLACDYWQTYIYRISIDYAELLRGHAPVAASSVQSFLDNPLENNTYLLAPDENFGELQKQASEQHVVLNDGEVKLCIATTGDLFTEWGRECMQNPLYSTQTLTNVRVYYTDVDNWQGFVNAVEEQCPQFFQTVKGVFLVPAKFLRGLNETTFCGYKFYVARAQTDLEVGKFEITKDKFGFSSEYDHLAKLYTYPYSAVVIDDLQGNQTVVRIEETAGTLPIRTVFDFMIPTLFIEARIQGVGANSTQTIDFKTSVDNTFQIGGRDYDFSTRWEIPTFAIQMTADADWEVNGKIGAVCTRDNAYNSANVSKTNSDASANTARTNADASAKSGYDNSTNSANVAKVNADASANTARTNADASAATTLDNANKSAANAQNTSKLSSEAAKKMYTYTSRENAIAYAQNSVTSNAAIQTSFDNAFVQFGASAVGNVISSASGGAAGVGMGIANTVNNGLVLSQVTTNNQVLNNVSQKTNADMISLLYGVDLDINLDSVNLNQIVNFTPSMGSLKGLEVATQNTLSTQITDAGATLTKVTAIANNTTSLANNERTQQQSLTNNENTWNGALVNAERSYNTSLANNERTQQQALENNARNYNCSIENTDRSYAASEAQSRIQVHPEFGSASGDAALAVKPMALRASILTQSKSALKLAAEQFLRFGYNLGMQWKISDFNLMPHFTYWKLGNMTARGDVYQGALDVVKSIMQNGITIWRNPDEIGKISIYDNKE